jgi:NAD(P)-dependent dehydrogenase (short-subunit alcohol dehydrogenase family)
VAPGTILFPGEKPAPLMQKVLDRNPLKRAGRPEDIADTVLYLATRGEFITGQVFVVDGGQSI